MYNEPALHNVGPLIDCNVFVYNCSPFSAFVLFDWGGVGFFFKKHTSLLFVQTVPQASSEAFFLNRVLFFFEDEMHLSSCWIVMTRRVAPRQPTTQHTSNTRAICRVWLTICGQIRGPSRSAVPIASFLRLGSHQRASALRLICRVPLERLSLLEVRA